MPTPTPDTSTNQSTSPSVDDAVVMSFMCDRQLADDLEQWQPEQATTGHNHNLLTRLYRCHRSITPRDPNLLESTLQEIAPDLPDQVIRWADSIDKDTRVTKQQAVDLIFNIATALLTERALTGRLENTG